MSNQNKILTTLNAALFVNLYGTTRPDGSLEMWSTLEGVPIGTSDGSSTGELAAKVVIVGARGTAQLNSGQGGVAVTPSDDDDIDTQDQPIRGMYVGTAGDLSVEMTDGSEVIYKNLAAGIVHPISPIKVLATGTTATDIVAVL